MYMLFGKKATYEFKVLENRTIYFMMPLILKNHRRTAAASRQLAAATFMAYPCCLRIPQIDRRKSQNSKQYYYRL